MSAELATPPFSGRCGGWTASTRAGVCRSTEPWATSQRARTLCSTCCRTPGQGPATWSTTARSITTNIRATFWWEAHAHQTANRPVGDWQLQCVCLSATPGPVQFPLAQRAAPAQPEWRRIQQHVPLQLGRLLRHWPHGRRDGTVGRLHFNPQRWKHHGGLSLPVLTDSFAIQPAEGTSPTTV